MSGTPLTRTRRVCAPEAATNERTPTGVVRFAGSQKAVTRRTLQADAQEVALLPRFPPLAHSSRQRWQPTRNAVSVGRSGPRMTCRLSLGRAALGPSLNSPAPIHDPRVSFTVVNTPHPGSSRPSPLVHNRPPSARIPPTAPSRQLFPLRRRYLLIVRISALIRMPPPPYSRLCRLHWVQSNFIIARQSTTRGRPWHEYLLSS